MPHGVVVSTIKDGEHRQPSAACMAEFSSGTVEPAAVAATSAAVFTTALTAAAGSSQAARSATAAIIPNTNVPARKQHSWICMAGMTI